MLPKIPDIGQTQTWFKPAFDMCQLHSYRFSLHSYERWGFSNSEVASGHVLTGFNSPCPTKKFL